MELTAIQKTGREFLLQKVPKPHHVLAWAPGVGKTPVACDAIRVGGIPSALIISPDPLIVKHHWKSHLTDWASIGQDYIHIVENGIDYIPVNKPFVIVGYAMLNKEMVLKQLRKRKFAVVIVDEAQRLKNFTSNRSKQVLSHDKNQTPIIGLGYYKWLLSGSLMPNRPIELFPALKTLAPETIRPYDSFEGFAKYFCNAYEERQRGHLTLVTKGASNVEELGKRISGFVDFKELVDVYPNMPEKLESFMYVPLDIPYDETNTPEATLRKQIGLAKLPYAVEYVKDRLSNDPSKLLLFAYTRTVVEGLVSGLQEHNAVCIYGGLSPEQKDLNIKQFINDPTCTVLIAQLMTGGQAIDGLQHVCHNIIHVEPEWSNGEDDQMAGRVWRAGQDKPVYITRLIAEGTRDDAIVSSRKFKRKVVQLLFSTLKKSQGDLEMTIEAQLDRIIELLEGNNVARTETGREELKKPLKTSDTVNTASVPDVKKEGKTKSPSKVETISQEELNEATLAVMKTLKTKIKDDKKVAELISEVVQKHGAKRLAETKPEKRVAVKADIEKLLDGDFESEPENELADV